MAEATQGLKQRLRTDLTQSMRDRDKLRTSTIRMVLAAITEAEVAGDSPTELTEQQTLDVVVRENKKRREASEAFTGAGRPELAEKELAEAAVLSDYLPQQLDPDEIAAIVTDAITETGAAELGPRGMGKVMGVVTPKTKGKADGRAVADEVKRQLSVG